MTTSHRGTVVGGLVAMAAVIAVVLMPSSASAAAPADASPTAPVILDPADGSLLTHGRPTFTGTGEAGDYVQVIDSVGIVLCANRVDADGTWWCNSISLPDGDYTTFAEQQNANGAWSPMSDEVGFSVLRGRAVVVEPQVARYDADEELERRQSEMSEHGALGAEADLRDGIEPPAFDPTPVDETPAVTGPAPRSESADDAAAAPVHASAVDTQAPRVVTGNPVTKPVADPVVTGISNQPVTGDAVDSDTVVIAPAALADDAPVAATANQAGGSSMSDLMFGSRSGVSLAPGEPGSSLLGIALIVAAVGATLRFGRRRG